MAIGIHLGEDNEEQVRVRRAGAETEGGGGGDKHRRTK